MHVDRCRSLHAGDRRWELLSHQLPVPAGRGPGAAGVAQPLSGRAVPSQADHRSVDGCYVERGLLLRHGSRLPCQRVGRVVPRYPAVRGDPLQEDGPVLRGDGEEAVPDLRAQRGALRCRALSERG